MNWKKILFGMFCVAIPMVLIGATIRWYNDAGIPQKTTMSGTEIFSMQQTGPNAYRWGYLNDIMRGWIATNDTRDIVLGGNMTAASWTATGALQGTNVTLTDTLVANLATPAANTYPMRYASDVITSRGTGDFVRWDGTNWRTMENVVAGATISNFIFAAYTQTLNVHTPISTIISIVELGTPTTAPFYSMQGASSGTGAGVAFPNTVSSYGADGYISAGTTTTGNARSWAFYAAKPSATVTISCVGFYHVNALSDASDVYWCLVGMANTTASGYPTTGAFFVYDAANTTGHGLTGASTNNWIAVSRNSSTQTVVDTGFPVSTSAANRNKLRLIAENAVVRFFTNDVLAATIIDNIPNASVTAQKHMITKTAGTTERVLFIAAPGIHYRHESRNF